MEFLIDDKSRAMLTELEKQSIQAALRNGLGFTMACTIIRKHPGLVTRFLNENQIFKHECQNILTMGRQSVLLMMNEALNKKEMSNWKKERDRMDNLVWDMNLWESAGVANDFSFELVSITLRRCKTAAETATSIGMTESEFFASVFKNEKLAVWMVQNGFQI